MYEYQTTTEAVASFYSAQGERAARPRTIRPPEGDGWELVSTAATESAVFYTWRRVTTDDSS